MGENRVRLFVNLLYDFKKNEKFPGIFAKLRKVLAENGWEQQRLLFDFHDVNDAQTEGKTPHAMLMKAFPQFAPYFRSAFEGYKALHPDQKELPPPHSYSCISNFPGRKAGKPVLSVPDAAVDLSLMEQVFAKVPHPYAFYSALAVLDGIDWGGGWNPVLAKDGSDGAGGWDEVPAKDGNDGAGGYNPVSERDGNGGAAGCDLSPAMDWVVILGKEEKDDWEAGDWTGGMDFDEICPFYQSNSVRIGKEWDLGPELTVQIEVFPGQGLALAKRVEEAFSKYFGTPTKRYARAVSPWEGREGCRAKRREMQEFFARWSKKMQLEVLRRQMEAKEHPSPAKKTVSRATLKKRFYAKNALERYPVSRWDDKQCRQKRLAHNYHLEVGLAVNETPPAARLQRNPVNCLYVECIGWNFELCGSLEVEDFAVTELAGSVRVKQGAAGSTAVGRESAAGNFAAETGDIAGELAFALWQEYLDRFEAEVVPELFRIFGETPREFVCDSRRMMRANEETIGTRFHRF